MEVGVRELRSHLSAHLQRVKAGQTVVVTEHGRPVAKLIPVEPTRLPANVAQLLETGAATWSGEVLPSATPLPLAPGGPTLAEVVGEDRR
jgi:prevent-host-death family protein